MTINRSQPGIKPILPIPRILRLLPRNRETARTISAEHRRTVSYPLAVRRARRDIRLSRVGAIPKPGANQERDLSWFDFGDPRGLSSDGKLLLIGEVGEGGGSHYTTYLRPTDGSPAIRLGEGNAGALTDDDGKYALSRVIGNPSKMYLLPAQGAPRGPFRDGFW